MIDDDAVAITEKMQHADVIAFARLQGDNKELLLIPGAVHTDLYDEWTSSRSTASKHFTVSI